MKKEPELGIWENKKKKKESNHIYLEKSGFAIKNKISEQACAANVNKVKRGRILSTLAKNMKATRLSQVSRHHKEKNADGGVKANVEMESKFLENTFLVFLSGKGQK